MKEPLEASKYVRRNLPAAAPRLVHGLGHLYKHHCIDGFGMLMLGSALVGFVSVWMAFGTLGFSMILLAAAWAAGVAADMAVTLQNRIS